MWPGMPFPNLDGRIHQSLVFFWRQQDDGETRSLNYSVYSRINFGFIPSHTTERSALIVPWFITFAAFTCEIERLGWFSFFLQGMRLEMRAYIVSNV